MKVLLLVITAIFSTNIYAKIALISYHPEFRAVEYNMKIIEKLSDEAIKAGATIIVIGEGAIDGYVQLDDGDDWTYWSKHLEKWCLPGHISTGESLCQNVEEVAQGMDNSNILDHWIHYAKANKIHFIFQIPEKDGNRYYNTAYVVNESGVIAKHRKKHLVISDIGYAWAGQSGTVVELPFGKVGLFICADGHSSDLFEEYASMGVYKFLGLGYGITPAKYEKHTKTTNLRGLIVDSNQYLGLVVKEGRKIMELRLKNGFALYDYEFNYIGRQIIKTPLF